MLFCKNLTVFSRLIELFFFFQAKKYIYNVGEKEYENGLLEKNGSWKDEEKIVEQIFLNECKKLTKWNEIILGIS